MAHNSCDSELESCLDQPVWHMNEDELVLSVPGLKIKFYLPPPNEALRKEIKWQRGSKQ